MLAKDGYSAAKILLLLFMTFGVLQLAVLLSVTFNSYVQMNRGWGCECQNDLRLVNQKQNEMELDNQNL